MGHAGFLQAGILLLTNPALEPGFTCSLCSAVGCIKLWLDHSGPQVRETWEFLLSQSVLLFLGWTGSISERFAPNPNGRHQPQRLAGWDDTHFSAGNPGAGLPIGIFKKLSNSYYASAQKPMQLCGLEHLDHLKLLQKSRMLL